MRLINSAYTRTATAQYHRYSLACIEDNALKIHYTFLRSEKISCAINYEKFVGTHIAPRNYNRVDFLAYASVRTAYRKPRLILNNLI